MIILFLGKLNYHIASLFHSLVIISLSLAGISAQPDIAYSLDGIWLGTMVLPNSVELRMGITISDGSNASLNMVDQATGEMPIDDMLHLKDSVAFNLERLGIHIAGKMDATKDAMKTKFKQRGGEFPITFRRVSELPKLARPQTPTAPFPYISEEIVFANQQAGIKVAGTLTIPKSDGKVPAVLLLTGSGQQGRDQDIAGHKHFWVIADYLSRKGIAVLRTDDRGIGGSTGDFKTSSSVDFAGDAIAGVRYLRTLPEIDTSKLGLIGHSEGFTVAAIAASKSNQVKFIVSLGGMGVNFKETIISQISNQLRMQNVSEEEIIQQEKWRHILYGIVEPSLDSATIAQKLWDAYGQLTEDEIVALNWPKGRQEHMVNQLLNPWWKYLIGLDIRKLLMQVQCPLLALYGKKDTQIDPTKNSLALEQALKAGGNSHFEIETLPGLNHLFQHAETGSEYEYVQIEETISPGVLMLISNWISVLGNQ